MDERAKIEVVARLRAIAAILDERRTKPSLYHGSPDMPEGCSREERLEVESETILETVELIFGKDVATEIAALACRKG